MKRCIVGKACYSLGRKSMSEDMQKANRKKWGTLDESDEQRAQLFHSKVLFLKKKRTYCKSVRLFRHEMKK